MNPPTTPITINRSIVGTIGLALAGLLGECIIFGLALFLAPQPDTPLIAVELLTMVGVVVMIVTVIAVATYEAGKIVLDQQGIHVRNMKTLFSSVESVVEWDELQEVTVLQTGLIQSLSGAGTLMLQSASAESYLSISWIPRVVYWRDYIFGVMDAAD